MPYSHLAVRDPAVMLEHALKHWRTAAPEQGLWVFGYASLIWRPDFEFTERRPARVQGWHRALQMWSSINRGSPECLGLVFALLTGGSCKGVVFRVAASQVEATLRALWEREMPTAVYDPKWLSCATPQGAVNALAFTLPRNSSQFCGVLSDAQYVQIFNEASGRYGTTLDYALKTYEALVREGIHDRALATLLRRCARCNTTTMGLRAGRA